MIEPQLSAEMRKKLYNILANFVNIVDDCHARGVEPDCNNEINLIEKVLVTALEEQRKAVIDEVLDWMDEMPLYIDGVDMSPFRAELRAKLEAMKGSK